MVQEDPPDLLLTDVEMPNRDGYSLCRAVKDDERLRELPVVICSSLGEARDLERGFDSGADGLPGQAGGRGGVDQPASRPARDPNGRNPRAGAGRGRLGRDPSPGGGLLASPRGLRWRPRSMVRMVWTRRCAAAGSGADRLRHAAHDPGSSWWWRSSGDLKTRDVPLVMLTARDHWPGPSPDACRGFDQLPGQAFHHGQVHRHRRAGARRVQAGSLQGGLEALHQRGAVEAAEQMSREKEPFTIRAREADATLLFSDISGFTAMSAKMTPKEVVGVLNASFDALCIAIKDHAETSTSSSETRSWRSSRNVRTLMNLTPFGRLGRPGRCSRLSGSSTRVGIPIC